VKRLEIQSSPRSESSDSISLARSFMEACNSNKTSIVVERLSVWHERFEEPVRSIAELEGPAVSHMDDAS
jgi:FMN-dependent NADH-azoreductase